MPLIGLFIVLEYLEIVSKELIMQFYWLDFKMMVLGLLKIHGELVGEKKDIFVFTVEILVECLVMHTRQYELCFIFYIL